jgi:hypothetical protein
MLTRFVQILIAGLLTLPGLAAAAGTVQLPATGQTTCFDAKGRMISCAGTGQDGDTQAGVEWPAHRFIDNGNGTVTDNLTGLIWSKMANAPGPAGCRPQPSGSDIMLWQEALDLIRCLNTGNFAGSRDWRLPNLNELESMVNAEALDSSAYLAAGGFIDVQASQYWTSASDASDDTIQSTAQAWDVDLVLGGFPFSTLKNQPDRPDLMKRVWPVRGASAQLWQTGQAGCFDLAGNGCSCAGTGEDGEHLSGAAWPAQRFKPNAGSTYALDKLTGLVWATATQTPGPAACADAGLIVTWQQALDHVKCLNQNAWLGVTDWRLPNRKELRSLVDYSKGAPALPSGNPFDDASGYTYWSSTTDPNLATSAWAVSMFTGGLSSAGKTGLLPVWPVSGPDLAPPALTLNQGNMTTNVAVQTISGTVEAGASVKVVVNGGAPVAASVAGSAWSFTINPLASGSNAVTVTADDFADNKSEKSINMTLDATAPALTVNAVVTPTNRKGQTIGGAVEAGSTVTITMGGRPLPVTVNGGTWSCSVTGLEAGTNTITVTAMDAVGNTATQSAAIGLIIPDGRFGGTAAVSIKDALKALRIAVGLVPATADDLIHGDVAPVGAPNGSINLDDALLIFKKSVGLPGF